MFRSQISVRTVALIVFAGMYDWTDFFVTFCSCSDNVCMHLRRGSDTERLASHHCPCGNLCLLEDASNE